MEYGTAWLNSMIDATINNHALWQNAFQQMERQASAQAREMEGPFIFHGEIDCPEEMLCYPTVTLEQVQYAGKTNWIEDLDGNFFTVGDATIDNLFEADKILRHAPERTREYDMLKTVEEKICYRVNHQHITENMAKNIIGDEIGVCLFNFTFRFEVTEYNDGEDRPVVSETYDIPADDEDEAREILKQYIRPVGFIITTIYHADGRKEKVSVTKNEITLRDVTCHRDNS